MRKSATRLLLLLLATSSGWAQEATPLTEAAKQVAGRFIERAGGKRGDVEAADTIAPASFRIILGEKDGIQAGDLLEIMAKRRSIVVN